MVPTAVMTALVGELARRTLMASAARARARRVAGATLYRVTLIGHLIFTAAILVMGSLAAFVLYDGDDWRIAALLGGFVALCLFAYPGAIVVEPSRGVRTRRWYGHPVCIAWHDVAELRPMDQVGQVVVISHSGRQIIHTSLHADDPGFRREVTYYARLTPRVVPQ
jgi:hypothetical protein